MSSVDVLQHYEVEDAGSAGTGMSGPYARMHEMIFGASIVQMIRCAALFRFADHLAVGPRTPDLVAAAEGLNVDATRRLMRACAAFGLMTVELDGRFGMTPLLATLRENDPSQLRYLAISQGGSGHWRPWGMLDQAVRTGAPQADTSLGTSFWEYLASNGGAEEANAFAKVFGGIFAAVDEAAAGHLATLDVGMVADIGGAEGSLLRALMHANPSLKGVLLDLPHVAHSASELAENVALGGRLTISGGSFFEAVRPISISCAPCFTTFRTRNASRSCIDVGRPVGQVLASPSLSSSCRTVRVHRSRPKSTLR